MAHHMILNFRDGMLMARCSCGGWSANTSALETDRLTHLYERIKGKHRDHVRAVEHQNDVPVHPDKP